MSYPAANCQVTHTPMGLVPLRRQDFLAFSAIIEKYSGIKMPESKMNMVESRLQKRLKAIGLHSFKSYHEYLLTPPGLKEELIYMIDAVTTNKTDFFRESSHFTFLSQYVLPKLAESCHAGVIPVWSAGCSSGEEPYTLAMVMNEFHEKCRSINFSILASDICTKVLEHAHRGIYEEERIAPIPVDLRRKYLLRSRDREKRLCRVAPELRSLITFRRINFLDDDFLLKDQMEIIFCRNVLIYFDRITQEKVISKFCRNLTPGGYLFLGHSETINGMELPLTQVHSTVYRKDK
jgi:chemotaxis protein methyltransferase CheR